MNAQMKNILSKYLFRCVVITCLLCFCAGIVTARQRSEYNSYFTPYAVLSVKNAGTQLKVSVDEKSYSIDFGRLRKFTAYKNYLYFTPLSSIVFFFDSFYEFFSSFKD